METKGNSNAFGYGFTTADGSSHVESSGLTIRTYIATQAMQGILSSPNIDIMKLSDPHKAEYAVIMSDYLITELNKEK